MGFAILTNATQQFQDSCSAVKTWEPLNDGDDIVAFQFDPSEDVNGPIPDGVYFELDRCTNGEHERRIRDAIRRRNGQVLEG